MADLSSARPRAVLADILVSGGVAAPDRAVLLDAGTIRGIVERSALPDDAEIVAEADIVSAGFIDLQINGAADVMFNDTPTVEALRAIAWGARQGGTAAILPTFITDSAEAMDHAIDAVRAAMDQGVPGIAGIHLEGPFINPSRKGTHEPAFIRMPEPEDAHHIVERTRGIPTLLTLAPERVTEDVISIFAAGGITVSLGHSDATLEEAARGVDAGITVATHLFNAMSQLGNREPGAVGAVLYDRRIRAGIIADGIHVHPSNLALAHRAKPDALFLVTDAMPTLAGTSDRFFIHGREIRLADGRLVDPNGVLSGAQVSMIESVRNAIRFMEIEMPAALSLATSVPADAARLSPGLGRIAPGARAALTLLTADLAVAGVIVDGTLFPPGH
ncbi:N-acetylglucosamine-6-phosphate deacetylase [Segnochrobactrum spirostomi]|uniref:N-acetylglucosamine-6-phosphate deacetylase n=1 Tax=Segnochrobactrum spirostomi TaxID=2608987 RepID=A0A6A7XY63_9HYPH|nr:N-acetylglucosamine-6-phosphate deacetylase [Segnochrobactrum spirostomi]MQT11644.1 N-acetylglucosamine-6-phosphate deacetylase [Segnochrobactrum spirostomi]